MVPPRGKRGGSARGVRTRQMVARTPSPSFPSPPTPTPTPTSQTTPLAARHAPQFAGINITSYVIAGRRVAEYTAPPDATRAVTQVQRQTPVPNLTDILSLYEWLDLVNNYVDVQLPEAHVHSEADWVPVITNAVSTADTDPLLATFRLDLVAFPVASLRAQEHVLVSWPRTSPHPQGAALLALIRSASRVSTSALPDASMHELVFARPCRLRDWLAAVIVSWRTEHVRQHFLRELLSLRFALPRRDRGLAVARAALSTHHRLFQQLVLLADYGRDASLLSHAFTQSFASYSQLYEAAEHAPTPKAALQPLLEKINLSYQPQAAVYARLHDQTPVVMSVVAPALTQPQAAAPPAAVSTLQPRFRRPGGPANSRPKGNRRAPYSSSSRGSTTQQRNSSYSNSSPQPNSRHRYNSRPASNYNTHNRRRSPSPQRRSPPPSRSSPQHSPSHPILCYHCNKLGHTAPNCYARARGEPRTFPQCPHGTSFADHVKAVLARDHRR